MVKIGVFDNYKKQQEVDAKVQTIDDLSEGNDNKLRVLHQKAEKLAGHELTILNSLRDKWHEARQRFLSFSYDKELTRKSSNWTTEDLMDLGREVNSYVKSAKIAKQKYIDKLREHLSLLENND